MARKRTVDARSPNAHNDQTMLRAKLFGRLAVEINGSSVPPIAGLKPRAVLVYLLLHPGLHPRARLAARFWPDVLDTSARASLRSALWSVRGALEAAGGEAYLAGDRSSVGISPDLPREVDVEQFDRALAVGDAASLREAVALATGPLLSDLADEWVLDAQDEYRDRLIVALERLADGAEQAGDAGAAIEWTKRALEQDRLREGSYRQLIRRLAAAGEPAQALTVYRRCRAVLAAELGMAPTAETRDVVARIRSGGADEADSVEPRPEPAVRASGIVGRGAQLASLTDVWRAGAAGRGGLALISGEAGIGKTRLASELVSLAVADGAIVGEGAPLELPGGPPFGPWLEVVQGLVAGAPAPPGDAPWPADLARLCPTVTTQWGRPSGVALGAPDLERGRLFEAVVELLSWCSKHRPVLVLLEDLHRADVASMTLLTYVGRRLGDLAALIVATRRNAPESGDLDASLDAFRSRGLMRAEVVLDAMSPEQIEAIIHEVAPSIDPGVALRVASIADGNPLLAREAARTAASGGEPFDGIRAAIRTPVRRLPPHARLLVEIAATAGRPLDRREAAEAVGAETLDDAFVAASETGLFDGSDRQVRFVHELVRQACYAELPHARREWLHSTIADLLIRRGATGAAEVARHLRLAGEDEAARPQLVIAARQAQALGALDEAAAFLREALEIPTADRSEATATWFALAEVEGWRERREAMDEAFERGLELVTRDPDPRALASAHAARGHLLRTGLCYPRESLAAYRRALEIIDEGRADVPEVRVLALAGVAWGEAMVGDPARVPSLIAEVTDQPEADDDLVLAIELDMVRVAAAIRENRLDDVEAPGERAIALARRVGRADLVSLTSTNVAAVAACRGQFTRVLELTEDGMTGGAAGPTLEGYIHAARAYAFARLGRHDEALAAAHAEVRMYEHYGQADFEALGAFDLGLILLAGGDAEAASHQLERALATPTRHFSVPLARLRNAEALLAGGDVDAAEAELGRFPFEPVREADMPAVLVAHLARLQGLDRRRAGRPRRGRAASAGGRGVVAAAHARTARGRDVRDRPRRPRAPARRRAGGAGDRARPSARRARVRARRGRTHRRGRGGRLGGVRARGRPRLRRVPPHPAGPSRGGRRCPGLRTSACAALRRSRSGSCCSIPPGSRNGGPGWTAWSSRPAP